MATYLGFDSSTQGLTATVIEVGSALRRVVLTEALSFDATLPAYRTRHGVLPSDDPRVVHAPPLMWAEALDLMMSRLTRHKEIDWTALRAISGSAQQHGSVYLSAGSADRLAALRPEEPLVRRFHEVFSRPTSPVWMDSSTTLECREIESTLGGWHRVANVTGSRCYERFTAAQIRKFATDEPAAYQGTERIHLVSSWLASLLAGADAPVDYGDASGTNLMALSPPAWWADAVQATAPGLGTKLPALSPSSAVVGTLAPYWRQKYGLPPARVVVWSGDNPCSLVGTGVVREGMLTISLGTSDTIFGPMRAPRVSPDGIGHVFATPTGAYMGMTVFRNGSLARERVRDMYALDWSGFSRALRSTPPGNGGAVMQPWFEPEITPPVLRPGVRRYDLSETDAAANVRAVVEGQMIAMALHSRWMGVRPDVIHTTGGASANHEILQVMADVFGAAVLVLPATNSAALGAALRAYHADALADGVALDWIEVVRGFTEPLPDRVEPITAHGEIYRRQMQRHEELEIAELAEGAEVAERRESDSRGDDSNRAKPG